jgi:small subunit ribosomal protein S18
MKALLKTPRVHKSLLYQLLLKQIPDQIDYKNIKILSLFISHNGKIKARRKTNLSAAQQRLVSYSIRKARTYKLLPDIFDVNN